MNHPPETSLSPGALLLAEVTSGGVRGEGVKHPHPDQMAMSYAYAPRYVVCFSGGHSSALVAVEVVRRYGREGVVLLNHDINPRVEDADIKRFKREVSAFLGVPITQADHPRVAEWDQFDVTEHARAFKVKNGEELCTNRLKTKPFRGWLAANCPPGTATLYYGFDAEEQARILRRSTIAAEWGYATAYPLAHWQRTIQSTREIGVEPPLTYSTFRHANCVGCLKAGWQHWYVVRATRPDIWERAKLAEERIGHTIHKDASLAEREEELDEMIAAGIKPTEHTQSGAFWATARKVTRHLPLFDAVGVKDERPCECVL